MKNNEASSLSVWDVFNEYADVRDDLECLLDSYDIRKISLMNWTKSGNAFYAVIRYSNGIVPQRAHSKEGKYLANNKYRW